MIHWIKVKKSENDFFITIPVLANIELNLYQESINNIKYITENYPSPYNLFVSGGVDSQAMLYFWKRSGIPFNAVSFTYNNNYNQHDLVTLKLFSDKIRIDVNYIDFDLLNFLEEEYFHFANTYRCGSPHICTYMKLSSLVTKGTNIFSGNFLGTKGPFIDKNNFSLYRYAYANNSSMIPYFFIETQRFAFSLKNTSRDKNQEYIDNNIPIIVPPQSYTGFEKIKEYYDIHKKHLVKPKDYLTRLSTQRSKRAFDVLLRNKFEYKFSSDKYDVRFILC